MPYLYDVGLKVCFSVHMPGAFKGNSRKNKEYLQREEVHTVFLLSIRKQDEDQEEQEPEDQT